MKIFDHAAASFIILVSVLSCSTRVAVSGARGYQNKLRPLKKGGSRKTCDNFFLPRYDKQKKDIVYAGKTYEQWANYWWYWTSGFNSSVSPFVDATGEYADIDQPKNGVFLLAGGPPGVERTITIPRGKLLFAPFVTFIVGFVEGDASDPSTTDNFISYLSNALSSAGIALPSKPTLNRLLSLAAKTYCENLIYNVTVQADNCTINPFKNGLVFTRPNHGFVLQNGTLFNFPANNFNAVQCGYFGMAGPWPKGSRSVTASAGRVISNQNTLLWTDRVFEPVDFVFQGVDHFIVV